ncbi:hypothetical protein [Marinicauda pacifica]|uniref:hypothetical protein n=1 Tax=Marinicauda pacifica TaxID=1133559 RepID=UPI0035C857D8
MKTALKTTLLAAGIALGGLSVAVAAPGQGHHGGGRGHSGLTHLAMFDLNGDNTVTRDEIASLKGEEFEWRDRNSDGYLDAEDASPMHRRMMEMREVRREEMRDDEDGRRGRGHRGRRGERGGWMDGQDADEDGRISRAEFVDGETRMFDRLDTDQDGSVTADELDAAMERREERHEDRREARRWWRN